MALDQETGARGLRSIVEASLMDVMFEIPSREDIRKVVITEEAVRGDAKPVILAENEQPLTWTDDEDMAA
jgi:ATP-dependent Clp protease ATP-binding subunit ClpX